jgi:hypothetical protein
MRLNCLEDNFECSKEMHNRRNKAWKGQNTHELKDICISNKQLRRKAVSNLNGNTMASIDADSTVAQNRTIEI